MIKVSISCINFRAVGSSVVLSIMSSICVVFHDLCSIRILLTSHLCCLAQGHRSDGCRGLCLVWNNEQTWTCHFLFFSFFFVFWTICNVLHKAIGIWSHDLSEFCVFRMCSQIVPYLVFQSVSYLYPAQNVSYIVCGISLLVVLCCLFVIYFIFLSFHRL